MHSRNKLSNCVMNITTCVQQTRSYTARRQLLAMQAASAHKYRQSEIPKEEVVHTTDGWGNGLLAGARLPTAVSLVSRNVADNARNEVKTAFIRYGKSMADLARIARKLYKRARLRNAPLQQPMPGNIVHDPRARPLRVPEPSACAITERLTKLFFRDPWDYPSGK